MHAAAALKRSDEVVIAGATTRHPADVPAAELLILPIASATGATRAFFTWSSTASGKDDEHARAAHLLRRRLLVAVASVVAGIASVVAATTDVGARHLGETAALGVVDHATGAAAFGEHAFRVEHELIADLRRSRRSDECR